MSVVPPAPLPNGCLCPLSESLIHASTNDWPGWHLLLMGLGLSSPCCLIGPCRHWFRARVDAKEGTLSFVLGTCTDFAVRCAL
jgi:hypothetical protein